MSKFRRIAAAAALALAVLGSAAASAAGSTPAGKNAPAHVVIHTMQPGDWWT